MKNPYKIAIQRKGTEEMYIHDMTEQAYKNGYEAGVKEFAEMLREILYPSVRLEYSDIDILEKEMLKGDAK